MIAKYSWLFGLCLCLSLFGGVLTESAFAQEAQTTQDAPEQSNAEGTDEIADKAADLAESTKANVDEIADRVDGDERAIQAKNSILTPIYRLAESMSFSAFHWIAFALMVAGVISYALQLVLGKLVVLSKMGLSFSEVLSDTMGLLISLVGLVLTTQAATENSSFTQSAFAVLSATALGVAVGFVFYLWGQRQELDAVEGRKAAAKNAKK